MHALTDSNQTTISLIIPTWNHSEGVVRAIEEADAACA